MVDDCEGDTLRVPDTLGVLLGVVEMLGVLLGVDEMLGVLLGVWLSLGDTDGLCDCEFVLDALLVSRWDLVPD
jgi:hypothetical protein